MPSCAEAARTVRCKITLTLWHRIAVITKLVTLIGRKLFLTQLCKSASYASRPADLPHSHPLTTLMDRNVLATFGVIVLLLVVGMFVLAVMARSRLRAARSAGVRAVENHSRMINEAHTIAHAHAHAAAHAHWHGREPVPPPPTINADELTRFKARPEQAENPCGICLDPFDDLDLTAGQCLHTFHTACVGAWLAKDAAHSCPVCRAPFLHPNDPALIDPAPSPPRMAFLPPQQLPPPLVPVAHFAQSGSSPPHPISQYNPHPFSPMTHYVLPPMHITPAPTSVQLHLA